MKFDTLMNHIAELEADLHIFILPDDDDGYQIVRDSSQLSNH